MEQQIRFCTTSDGVRIAYATVGEGPPLIWVAGWLSHLELSWENAQFRSAIEAYARRFTVIRYDKRGTGLSDRDLADYSVGGRLMDLEAVAAALGLKQHAVLGVSEGGPIGIAYAARYPDRVTRLALHGTFASGRALVRRQRELGNALIGLIRAEWDLGSATVTSLLNPAAASDAGPPGGLGREAASAEAAAEMIQAMGAIDVTGDLPKIVAPTIVVHGRDDRAIPFELGRELASAIPGARFFPFDGGHQPSDAETLRRVGRTIRHFLAGIEGEDGASDRPARPDAPDLRSGTAIILFVDIADSTSLTERLGDAAFRDMARALDARLRDAIRDAAGTPVDGAVLGDGVMGVFTSAREAIDAAQRCHALSSETELRLHAGIHAGDVIGEEKNVYGGAVNIAARIAGDSQPGEVLVSQTVRDLARTSAGVAFEDRGERSLKGIADPVRVFAVRAG